MATLFDDFIKGVSKAATTLRHAEREAPEISKEVKPFFHGTENAWKGHVPGPAKTGIVNTGNLYGPGLYMTENKEVAASYATATNILTGKPLGTQQKKEGLIYELGWKEKPNLIDLDKPLSPDVLNVIGNQINISGVDIPEAKRSEMISQLADKPGTDVYTYVTRGPFGMGGSKPKTRIMQALREQGYHGFTHTGGTMAGGGKILHRVNIAFAPDKDLIVKTTSSARHGARPHSRSAMGGIAYLQ